MSTLVSSETTAEADNQSVGVEALNQLYDTCRIALILQPSLLELHLDIFEELSLQSLTGSPDFLIGAIVDAMPDLLVRLVVQEVLVEVLVIYTQPLSSSPCGEVNTIGNVTYVVFLGIVALPDRCEHLLRHLTMEPADAIDLLTGVAGEGRHTEFLALVVGVGTTHTDELIPSDAELGRIAAHVLAEETFVKVVVTGRNRSMNGIETTGANQLKSLVERQTILLDVVAQTLQVAECGVTLVAMIDVFLDAELLQQQHTTDTQQNLLFQTVLPVTTIERVCDGLVEVGVHFIVGIEQVQLHTTDVHTPYVSVNHIIGVRNVNNQRIAVLVHLTLDGQ